MTICVYCGEEFVAKKATRQKYCSASCRRKRWWHDNRAQAMRTQQVWRVTNPGYLGPARQARVDKVSALKEASPCVDCGHFFPACCMDFDHAIGDKLAEVGVLAARSATWELIQAEIDKCDLVCANCHRIRTRDGGSLGWTRTLSDDGAKGLEKDEKHKSQGHGVVGRGEM